MAPVTTSKIATVTLSSNSSTIDFTNIPQIYTDLKLVCSLRSTRATYTNDDFFVNINGLTTNQSNRYLQANGSGTTSSTSSRWGGLIPADGATTASIFGNAEIYISNYTSSNYKASSLESVNENNATESYTIIKGNLWSSVDAITRLTLVCADGNFKPYSTATLYGIKSLEKSAYASGGEVSEIGGYYIHTFKGNGTFTPTVPLSVEYLVVAGGGGGGRGHGGGGGAGGLLTGSISLLAQNYSITIGDGGAGSSSGGVGSSPKGSNGSNSTFAGLTAIGGGGGGSRDIDTNTNHTGSNGGSGGGSSVNSSTAGSGGSGTTGQGNNGGNGNISGLIANGGGGGAGAVGGNASSGTAGNGGIGYLSSISGASTYYAGGGGGGNANGAAGGTGGSGGGANGASSGSSNASNATVNTGGGGGGGGSTDGGVRSNGGNGGSGIVIIRYRK